METRGRITMTQTPQPILASEKISHVLKQHPHLLDTLIDLSPAFRNLRNPVLRRVQTRLVTVAQAAGIAGIEPAVLTQKLNQAAGLSVPCSSEPLADAKSTSVDEHHAGFETAPIAAEIDVRPLMARGEEPFKAIMAAARTVPEGSAVRLIAGFEPLPLYDVLAKQGFRHRACQPDPGVWDVTFLREAAPSSHDSRAVVHEPASSASIDWASSATAEVTIDVGELVPPEPMIKILEALEALPPGGRLLVHHVRRPIHLYERLDELNYAHDTRELGPGRIELMIQKRPR
jgi:uncharacterized protein (DUF2249 family)